MKKTVAEFCMMIQEWDIELTMKSVVDEAWAHYESTKLYQVIKNLISNPIKFSPLGKEISVHLDSDYFELHRVVQTGCRVKI